MSFVLYFYISAYDNALIDDNYIFIQYARNLLESGTWGFYSDIASNSATSPLNVILIAGTAILTGSVENAVTWLNWGLLLAILFTLVWLSRMLFNGLMFGVLVFWGVIFNPLIMSTLGMEGLLLILFLLVAISCVIKNAWYGLAITCSALTLTRPDGFLFSLILLYFIPSIRRRLLFLLLYFILLTPWFLFSWVALGSVIPDSFFAKCGWSWGRWSYWNGIGIYFIKFPVETILSVTLLPACALCFKKMPRDVKMCTRLVLCIGICHFVAYSLLSVPPFHWYYIPQIFTILFAGGLVLWSERERERKYSKISGYVFVTAIALPAVFLGARLTQEEFELKEAPVHSNWGTTEMYREIGIWLKENIEPGAGIDLVNCELGTLAFFSERHLLGDELSDRRMLEKNVQTTIAEGGLKGVLYRINFAFLKKSTGYPEISYILEGRSPPRTEAASQDEFTQIKRWVLASKWQTIAGEPKVWDLILRKIPVQSSIGDK